MPPQEDRSQKTEKPTAKRLKKAREDGQTARSQEVPAVMTLVGFLVFAHFIGPTWLDRLRGLMVAVFSTTGPSDLTAAAAMALFRTTATSTAILLATPLGVLSLAGVAGNLVQGPPALSVHPFKPKWDKLNPFQGIKKVVSLKQLVEVLKSVLKMLLYGAVAFTASRDVVREMPAAGPGVEGTLGLLFTLAATVIMRVAAVAAALAVLDWLFRRYDHTRTLKMSKREIKEEHKQTEGDPHVRARIRRKQADMSRARMMAAVPDATVVITNPTEYAIALRYVPGETSAPKLLAKGRALLAERIRSIATEHRIPIISDPPLARAIYRSVPIGNEIPPGLFRAVAEVLALVMRRPPRRHRDLPDDGATP